MLLYKQPDLATTQKAPAISKAKHYTAKTRHGSPTPSTTASLTLTMEEPLVDEMDLCSLVERSPMTDIQVDFGSDRRRDLDIERERDRRREITSIRQQEYFVPGDGINHEIIEADITRYLGNDALVRPGDYEVSIESLCSDD